MELTNMSRPKIADHNITTGEMIVREMTDAELVQYELDKNEAIAREEALLEKKAQRQAILDRLGLTAEEAALLLGGN
jgi:predicted GIY-YIG superfamily endonuclease